MLTEVALHYYISLSDRWILIYGFNLARLAATGRDMSECFQGVIVQLFN